MHSRLAKLLAARKLKQNWSSLDNRAAKFETKMHKLMRRLFFACKKRTMGLMTTFTAAEPEELTEQQKEENKAKLAVLLLLLSAKLEAELEDEVDDWDESMEDILDATSESFSTLTALQLGFDPQAPTKAQGNWVKEYIGIITALIVASMVKKVLAAVEKAKAEGQALSEVLDKVNVVFGNFIQNQAPNVAAQMVTTVASVAQQMTIDALPIPATKEVAQTWLTKEDEKVRSSHEKLHGEVRAFGDEFKPGLRYPHDPNAPIEETANCRCWLKVGLVNKEMVEAA